MPSRPGPDHTPLALLSGRGRAWHAFFPIAALYAAVVVPLSLQAMLGDTPWLPALASPLGHARELLAGFALCVVTGYLLGIAPAWQRWGLLALWAGARAAWFGAPGSVPALAMQAAFGLAFVAILVPKFIGRRRKLRNLSVAPLLLLLGATPTLFDLAPALPGADAGALALAWVLLYAWLMAFMGGRFLAAAAAGAHYRQGETLGPRVQPVVEAATIVTLGGAALTALRPGGWWLCGGLLLTAGALLAVRLARWRLWHCRKRLDLWCLGIGYGWLAAGCALVGGVLLAGGRPFGWLHALTVGALGTLTLNVMLRTRYLRAGEAAFSHPLLPMGTALLAFAATVRLANTALPTRPEGLLWAAAAAWAIVFLRLAVALRGASYPLRRHDTG